MHHGLCKENGSQNCGSSVRHSHKAD
uniref:Uncharacterized protein n=1 Tax=Lotus japonicus TaxID=34305 RepID=I3SGK8_LOTJA|nr:unknown [Lotus japonicus]